MFYLVLAVGFLTMFISFFTGDQMFLVMGVGLFVVLFSFQFKFMNSVVILLKRLGEK